MWALWSIILLFFAFWLSDQFCESQAFSLTPATTAEGLYSIAAREGDDCGEFVGKAPTQGRSPLSLCGVHIDSMNALAILLLGVSDGAVSAENRADRCRSAQAAVSVWRL